MTHHPRWTVGIVGIVVALLVLAALACSVEFDTAHFDNARMVTHPEEDTRARVYAPEDTFYCEVEVKDVKADTPVKAVWRIVNVEGEAPDTVFAEYEIETGNGMVIFEAAPTEGDTWPAGEYALDLYLDGDKKETLTFKVK